MEPERAWLALVENTATLTDQVEPVRPARISRLNSVVEAINECGEFDAQLAHARSGDIRSFHFIFWAAEEHFVAHVRLHLPHIRGMRLKDVNRVEADLVAILLGELVQGG